MTINFNSLNKGLDMHLPLDQTHKNGAAIYSDISAQSNHGTAVGSPTATTDRFGVDNKALAFDGLNQYIDLSSTDFLSKYAGDTKGSISVWFKTSVTGVTKMLMGIGNNLTNNTYFSIITAYTNDKIGFEVTNAGSTLISILTANAMNDDNWHHMVVTSDGVTSLMYIDSVVEADTDSGEWLSSLTGLNTFRIGDLELLSVVNSFWNGSIDDVRYYSGRALSQAEVTALYQSSGPGNTQTNNLNKGLALHLPLDQVHKNGAAIYSDLSAQSNHGTAVGSPTATTDRFGVADKALAFDGTSDYVTLSHNPIQGTGDFSMSVWMNGSVGATNFGGFVLGAGGTVAKSANIGSSLGFINAGLYGKPQSTGVSAIGWHLVNLVYTQLDTRTKIYVDGILKAQDVSGTADITGGASLCKFTTGIPYFFKGSLNNARAYGYALSQAEVTALYNSSGPGNIIYTP